MKTSTTEDALFTEIEDMRDNLVDRAIGNGTALEGKKEMIFKWFTENVCTTPSPCTYYIRFHSS